MPTQTFWTEPTDRQRLSLRRYSSGPECPNGSYHNAKTPIGEVVRGHNTEPPADEYTGDSRWPTHCACGYEFTDMDARQVFTERIYQRPDTGEEWSVQELPSGAMYDAYWMYDAAKNSDGISLAVILPPEAGRHFPWLVDAQASNCTRKDEPMGSHKCWVRHGDPRTEPVTVDKNGDTCAAGAGSIAAGGYHGFLQNGVLT